ncbi:MAG: long-chain-acyl-CoA synthetase [Acidimicrobiales bacterium]
MLLPHRRIASDLRLTLTLGRALPSLAKVWPQRGYTVADLIEAQASRHGDRDALVSADEVITYRELDDRSNQVARWAQDEGIGLGDVVALVMPNRPAYIVYWLGLAKIGAATALINTNLVGRSLAHSVSVADAGHVIVDAELAQSWAGAQDLLDCDPQLWSVGGRVGGADDLDGAVAAQSGAPLADDVREGLETTDRLFYIYTSGTTGLPKAANFSHLRFIGAAEGAKAIAGLKGHDRLYITLPLYHSAGGVMAVGSALAAGATAVIAPRFSASQFWDDCVEHDITVFQYIGELCRYLLNSPAHPLEREHRIRVAIGNGLRADVWEAFQDRFAIPRIVEFYSATEGNVTLLNVDNKVGAVGRLPPAMRRAIGVHLLKVDLETEEVVRDGAGRCQEAGVGEVGEAVGRITRTVPFEGYSDQQATEKKILHDVFRPGDSYFRTGDLLRRDRDHYFYFVDRMGDTFRWKGENVATGEVGEVIQTCPGVLEATVYGVAIPGADGRAGMASLAVDDTFDLDVLARRVTDQLPSYARPLFLRLQEALDITGTFKHRKVDLVADGFDPGSVADPLYRLDAAENRYVPLTKADHRRVTTGKVKL